MYFPKTRSNGSKFTIMIITVNFEPLLQVFLKYMLQFDKFFAKKSTMNTKGMSLLLRGSQGNMNYWPKSENGFSWQ